MKGPAVMKGTGKGAPPPPPPKGVAKAAASRGARPLQSRELASPVFAGIESVQLKPTTTRVRLRDGTVFCETRSSDGEAFDRSISQEKAETPQYVLDQEAGISRLEPKEFDACSSRWRSVAVSSTANADGNDWLLHRGKLRLVSYNVWFSEHRQEERAYALFNVVEHEHADIICLQEVTPRFLRWLRDVPWVREHYLLSDSVGTTLRGAKLTYGVVMLVRRTLVISSLTLHNLQTRMNRAALVACFPLGGSQLRVATAHLESLNNMELRKNQLQSIFHVLVSESNTENRLLLGRPLVPDSQLFGSILAGDMNFDDGNPEEAIVAQAGFSDCWKSCVVDTADASDNASHVTMPFDDAIGLPTRIDRVFLGTCRPQSIGWTIVPQTMRRLGIESMDVDSTGDHVADENRSSPLQEVPHEGDTDDDMPDLIPVENAGVVKVPKEISTPSDHYGLFCEFSLLGTCDDHLDCV